MSKPRASRVKSTIGRALHGSIHRALAVLSRLAPPLAARLAVRLFVRPLRTGPAAGTHLAAGARSIRLDAAGRSLAAWQWGEAGPTALLVHGWGGNGLQLAAVGRGLAQRGWRAVALDLPAHGRSAGRSTNLLELAEVVAAAVREVGATAVVAHSFGTAASLVAIDRHGIRPERLATLAPATDMAGLRQRYAQMTGFSPGVVERMAGLLSRRIGFAWEQIEGAALAPRIAAEVLVIHDRDDRMIPAAEAAALARSLPDARLRRTRGLGHYALLDDPEVVAEVVDFATAPALPAASAGVGR